jgi:hypothetical protein
MKKESRTSDKNRKEINIETMNESNSKILIKTSRVVAVSENNKVQNYEDYINDKYLTGAIVRTLDKKKSRKELN